MTNHEVTEPASHAENEPELPLFNGVVQVLDLIKRLYRRRRQNQSKANGNTERNSGKQSKWLPMLCLIRPHAQNGLLTGIAERLKRARPHRVPHAFVRLEPGPVEVNQDLATTESPRPPKTPEDVKKIRDILRRITNELSDTRNRGTRRLRFRRFDLALWLMRKDLSSYDSTEREAALRRSLRRSEPDTLRDGIDDASAPKWWWYIISTLTVFGWLWSRFTLAGRIPRPGRIYWWFVHQRYLAAEDPGSFIGFAERLTAGEWQKESREQVVKFLTAALLEDLRREYGGMPWYRGRRRTAHAIVLLDDITRDNGGYTLLKTINDIRNELGLHDPLLIITASKKVPPHAIEPTMGDIRDAVYDAPQAEIGYEGWLRSLTEERRKRREMAFYLPIATSGIPDENELRNIRRELAAKGGYTMDRPPWWSRRALWISACAVLLIASAGAYVCYSWSHCGSGLWWPDQSSTLTYEKGECIGVSDGSHHFFTSDNSGQDERPWSNDNSIENTILEQNRDAENKYENPTPGSGERKIITLVHIGSLTRNKAEGGDTATQWEALAGIATAQHKNNDPHNGAFPLVRILIANAGSGMNQGVEVADQIKGIMRNDDSDLASSEYPLVGVVGFDESSTATEQTIANLTSAGLPMIADNLSADTFAKDHQLYYSVVPQNDREAKVAATFAKNLQGELIQGAPPPAGKDVNIYYPDPGDTYTDNLRFDVGRSMSDAGSKSIETSFDPTPDGANKAGQSTCGATGMVYYAGRASSFVSFLEGVNTCGDTPPTILADDDVSKSVANENDRRRLSVPFYFESFAVAPNNADPYLDPNLTGKAKEFYNHLYCITHPGHKTNDPCPSGTQEEKPGDHSLDGHAALAYDATQAMMVAVRHAQNSCVGIAPQQECSVNPTTVHSAMNTVSLPQGVTGSIDFGKGATPNVPVDKPISIIRFPRKPGKTPEVIGVCGKQDGSDNPRPTLQYCPTRTGSNSS